MCRLKKEAVKTDGRKEEAPLLKKKTRQQFKKNKKFYLNRSTDIIS